MKIATLFTAAGLVIASMGVTSAASAQDYHGDRGYNDHDRNMNDRGDHDRDRGDRDHHNGWDRGDRGNHYGWNRGHGRHCRTEWRYHHRVTRCYR